MADALNVSKIEKNIAQKVALAEADVLNRDAQKAADEKAAAQTANESAAKKAALNEEKVGDNVIVNNYDVSDITLNSTWKCKRVNDKYMFDVTPTVGRKSVSVKVDTLAGTEIDHATVKAVASSPETGIGSLTVNTVGLSKDKGSASGANIQRSAEIRPVVSGGEITLDFAFVANGNKKDSAEHTASLKLSKIELAVVFQTIPAADTKDKPATEFPVPPQTVAIYDSSTKKAYAFDGVIKLQHTGTLKMEEDLSEKKAYEKNQYLNNAKVEPDKVTLNVIMSDVYTDENDLTSTVKVGKNGKKTSSGETRSTAAMKVLHTLKDDRARLVVITPQYIYSDMLLSGLSISQNEDNPYGWEGQITFQKAYEQKPKKDDPQVKNTDTGDAQKTPSFFSRIFNITQNIIQNVTGALK